MTTENENKICEGIVHPELVLTDEDEFEEKPLVDKTNECHENQPSLQGCLVSSSNKDIKDDSSDNILEQLVEAILSCEKTTTSSKPEQEKSSQDNLLVNVEDLIEEISDSSDEKETKTNITNNPYNTRNKRKNKRRKILIEDGVDDTDHDPDFSVNGMSSEDVSDSESSDSTPRHR